MWHALIRLALTLLSLSSHCLSPTGSTPNAHPRCKQDSLGPLSATECPHLSGSWHNATSGQETWTNHSILCLFKAI